MIDRIVMHKTIKSNLHLFKRILERLKLVTSMLLYVTEVFEGRKNRIDEQLPFKETFKEY